MAQPQLLHAGITGLRWGASEMPRDRVRPTRWFQMGNCTSLGVWSILHDNMTLTVIFCGLFKGFIERSAGIYSGQTSVRRTYHDRVLASSLPQWAFFFYLEDVSFAWEAVTALERKCSPDLILNLVMGTRWEIRQTLKLWKGSIFHVEPQKHLAEQLAQLSSTATLFPCT